MFSTYWIISKFLFSISQILLLLDPSDGDACCIFLFIYNTHQLQNFCLLFLKKFYFSDKLLIFSPCIIFLILLNCLSVLSVVYWVSFEKLFEFFVSSKSHIFMSLSLVSERWLWSLGGVTIPWFFMLLEVLHCCLQIWSGCHLLQSLLTAHFKVFKLMFFSTTSPLQTWTFTNALSSVDDY